MPDDDKDIDEVAETVADTNAVSAPTDGTDVTLEPEDGEGNTESLEQKMSELRDELAFVKRERDEYLDGWQRAKADFVNTKKRIEDERQLDAQFASIGIIKALLPVLDSFEAAMAHTSENATFVEGIRNTHLQLLNVLDGYGVKPFEPKGVQFDPAIHEPVEAVDVESQNLDNTVTAVHQKGYSMKGKLLRPARVSVGHYKGLNA